MKLSTAEAIIRWEDEDEVDHFEEVTSGEQYATGRWEKFLSQVFRDKRDGTLWEITWSSGLTEMQDHGPDNIEVRQVEAYQETITKYRPTAAKEATK